jgi:hypothetical protein
MYQRSEGEKSDISGVGTMSGINSTALMNGSMNPNTVSKRAKL